MQSVLSLQFVGTFGIRPVGAETVFRNQNKNGGAWLVIALKSYAFPGFPSNGNSSAGVMASGFLKIF